ncbi:MAG TPA: sigma 54-interacting transcriptional regulator [Planctomycetota bacterium]|nr:sigma 54-interacting transcriptional regulator [Planctomycetota bacterium]
MQRFKRPEASSCGDAPARGFDRRMMPAHPERPSDALDVLAAKVLICPALPGIEQLTALFDQHGCIPIVSKDMADALRLLKMDDVDVVLLVLSPDPAQNDPKATIKAVQSIKECSPTTEVALYHPSDVSISLADHCQYIIAGVRSFVSEQTCGSAAELARRVRDCAILKRRNRQREIELDAHDIPGRFGIVGNSPAMRKVFNAVQKAAVLSDASVLITGESGTGKELLAQAIHNLDEKRREHPFVVVNCSAITPTLAESELFGHKRGAFTGSVDDRLGYFRAANGGTIFLDEMSEMDLSLQPKLLRVLQESRVMPVGGEEEEEIDVRVIAASNRDLTECVRTGAFRLDLFQRLNVIPIEVPPLRMRRDDILPLIMHFVRKHAGHYRGTIAKVEPRVVDAIAALDSEGNVRQLENLVRHVLLTKEAGDTLELSDLPRNVISKLLTAPDSNGEQTVAEHLFERITRDGMSLQDVLDYCEHLVLDKALAQTGHNQTKTAELLKTTPRTIFNKIRKHG